MLKKFSLSAFIAVLALVFLLGCKQPELNKIESVVAKVEYIVEGSSFNAADIVQTIVRFKDGRVKAFNGISSEVFYEGKRNIITYDDRDKIISVTVSNEK